MNKELRIISILNVFIILLSVIAAVCGICSFQTGQFYETANQYGETVKMWAKPVAENYIQNFGIMNLLLYYYDCAILYLLER